MLHRHIDTGEIREFIPGMKIHESWKPFHRLRQGNGILTVSEVRPDSISSHRSRKAAETRAKNKANKKTEAGKRKLGAVEADVVVDKRGKSKGLANLREKKAGK